MNKVSVSVFVPLIEQEYDLFIPINKTIGVVKQLVEKAIVELSDGNFKSNGDTKLYNKLTNQVYDGAIFVKDSNIRNGTQLILL